MGHVFEIHPDDSDCMALSGGEIVIEGQGPIEIPMEWLIPMAEDEEPEEHAELRHEAQGGRILYREPVVYSLDEHRESLEGPALDPVHLYLRSEVGPERFPHHPDVVSAILKARCDHHYWAPLIEEGRAGRFSGYFNDFRTALSALERHLPPRGDAELNKAWDLAWNLLEAGMPAREMGNGQLMAAGTPGLH